MDNAKVKEIKRKAENIIINEINKGSDKVTTLQKDPSAKYEAPDNLKADSTILED